MNGSALAVGDRARFRLPDKSVHRGVVTAINGDGTYSLEEEGSGAAHRLPGAKVKPFVLDRDAVSELDGEELLAAMEFYPDEVAADETVSAVILGGL